MAVSRLACLELGFSARKATEWDEIQHAVTVFTALETSDVDTQMALRTQRELAARGKRGRKIVDLLVAATAMRLGLTVLHYDRDFDHISAITGQRTEWVAKAGSID
jgi:predicted nucleic acid-binding protein